MSENQLAPWENEKLSLSGKTLLVLGLLSCCCHTATPAPQIPPRPECIREAAMFLQHCRCSSRARQEEDAAPQERGAPHHG